MRRGIVFALPSLLLFVSAALLAQVTSSSIFGTVTDTTCAVVPGVEIMVTQQETNFTRSTLADETGHYSIRFLPLGKYRVEITIAGFKKFSQTGIVLDINRDARVDAVLQSRQRQQREAAGDEFEPEQHDHHEADRKDQRADEQLAGRDRGGERKARRRAEQRPG